MLEYIKKNYTWILSGIGVPILGYIFYLLKNIVFGKTTEINKVTMKNINAKGDVIGRDKG